MSLIGSEPIKDTDQGSGLQAFDFTQKRTPTASDDRHAQLIDAARLLRSWIATQRAAWDAAPPQSTETTLPAEIAIPDEAPAASEPEPFRFESPSVPPDLLEISAERARAIVARLPTRAIVRWSFRGVAAAACLAGLTVLGARGLAYWSAWRNTPATGTVIVESDPPGSLVSVDGSPLERTPITRELPVGRHFVQFQRRSETRILAVDVVKGRSTVSRLEWNRVRTGRLDVRSDPAGARVLVDGRVRGVTPLSIEAPLGPHVVVLESSQGLVTKTVDVTGNAAAVVSEAIYSGWLRVSSPIELMVRKGNDGIRLDERNQALIAPGSHDLWFENRALGFKEMRRIEVKPGETTALVIDPPPSKLTVTATMPAEVLIDGERAGETPLIDYPVHIGTRDVTIKSASGAQRHATLTVTVTPARVDVDFSRP